MTCDSQAVGQSIAVLKGDVTRYLLMSMNLGIWNIKHDFIQVTTDSC